MTKRNRKLINKFVNSLLLVNYQRKLVKLHQIPKLKETGNLNLGMKNFIIGEAFYRDKFIFQTLSS